MILKESFVRLLRLNFRLHWEGLHGVPHWSRVRDHGFSLAAETGADLRVVEYFAFLHDSCRHDDGHDSEHGPRAARFAMAIRANHIHLDNAAFDKLISALEGHTGGSNPGDATIATCWDADRLDIGRVGCAPNPKYLSTEAARRPEVIASALGRSRAWLDRYTRKTDDSARR